MTYYTPFVSKVVGCIKFNFLYNMPTMMGEIVCQEGGVQEPRLYSRGSAVHFTGPLVTFNIFHPQNQYLQMLIQDQDRYPYHHQ